MNDSHVTANILLVQDIVQDIVQEMAIFYGKTRQSRKMYFLQLTG